MKLSWFSCILFLVLILPGTMYGQDNLKNEQLTCVSTTYEPFVIERDGKIEGIDVDVVREIGRRIGLNIKLKLKPWKRLERDIEKGAESCGFAYFRTPERLKYMDYTNIPLHLTEYSLFVNKDNPIKYNKLADIKGMVVGVNFGFKTTREFENAQKNGLFSVIRKYTDQDSFKFLKKKMRIEAVLTNYHVGLYTASKLGMEVRALSPPLTSNPCYLTFSKKRKLSHLIPKFDTALSQILKDGTYDKIFKKYTLKN